MYVSRAVSFRMKMSSRIGLTRKGGGRAAGGRPADHHDHREEEPGNVRPDVLEHSTIQAQDHAPAASFTSIATTASAGPVAPRFSPSGSPSAGALSLREESDRTPASASAIRDGVQASWISSGRNFSPAAILGRPTQSTVARRRATREVDPAGRGGSVGG